MTSSLKRILPAFAGLLLLCLLCPIPVAGQAQQPSFANGTELMVALLEEVQRLASPQRNAYLSEQRWRGVSRVPLPADPNDRARLLFIRGQEELRSGRSEAAVGSLGSLIEILEANPGIEQDESTLRRVREMRALAWLRLGEQENCVEQHNLDRCLLPIRDSGVHSQQRGSRGALEAYTELLTDHPDDLSYLWLLNLASMTLGEYPDGVPERWRLPPESFESDDDVGRFTDVAPSVGLDVFGLSGGSIVDDFNGDGYLDVIASGWGLDEQLRVFVNDRRGSFEDVTRAAGLVGIVGGLNLVQADYDNDGRLDFLVLRGAWMADDGKHPNSLIRNLGNDQEGRPRFEDVTEQAGLMSFHPTQAAAWGDYDNDGWARPLHRQRVDDRRPPPDGALPQQRSRRGRSGDLHRRRRRVRRGPDRLQQGGGLGRLRQRRPPRPVPVDDVGGRPQRALSQPRPEPGGHLALRGRHRARGGGGPAQQLPGVVLRLRQRRLARHLRLAAYDARAGRRRRRELPRPQGLGPPAVAGALPEHGRSGRRAAVRPNVARGGRPGDRPFLPMGANFGDLDNDGWLDFYLGTGEPALESLMPNRMFRNDGGRRFLDVTTSGGFGHLQKGHGVSFADLDNDGDQDVHTVMGGAFSGDGFHNALFLNPGHGRHWVSLDLEGTSANRAAIGARVHVRARGPEGERSIHRVVGSGGSFGANSLRLEVGLGEASEIPFVEIRWPGSSSTQRIGPLAVDRFYRVRQGIEVATPLELDRLSLGGASRGHRH